MTLRFETSGDLVATLKKNPDVMVVTDKFIAIWHSGLRVAILIPGGFERISDQAAEEILNQNLKVLNAQLTS